MITEKSPGYFAPLTGVRAVAAYMVCIHHYKIFKQNESIHLFANELHVGVTLFFVLSGFLIAYRYYDIVDFNFKTYIINRIARIFPMYFILTTLTFVCFYFMKDIAFEEHIGAYLMNITLLKGFFSEFIFTGIGQGWSLTVEETFYLLAPLFFLLIRRKLIYLIILPVLCILLGVLLVNVFQGISFYGFFQSYELLFSYTFFGRCFEFFIGIGLALVYKRQWFIIKHNYYTYAGIVLIVLNIIWISILKGEAEYGIHHPIGKLVNNFILPLVGISVFYLGLIRENTWVSKLLGSKPLVLMGKSSYIFYLIHMGVFYSLFISMFHNGVLTFIAINATSVILFLFIEEPLNHRIRKYFNPATIRPNKS